MTSLEFDRWSTTLLALLTALLPLLIVCLRESTMERLVALEFGGVITAMLLLVVSKHLDRPSYVGVGLTVAFLAFASALVFVRFFERWL